METSEVKALRAPGEGWGWRRRVLEPGPGSSSLGRQGGAPGPRLNHNPPTRGGSLWGPSTSRGGRATSSDLGWVFPMARNLTKSTLLYLTLPATVARGYLGPAPPVTGSADALQLGRSASAPHSARAPPPGGLASPRRVAHWLGQQDSAPSPAPPAAPPPPHRLSLHSQVGKVAATIKQSQVAK